MNVSIPILNGGLFKARQTEAEMKAKAVTENVNDLQNRITRDVRVAWLNATTAYDRMGLTRQLLEQAKIWSRSGPDALRPWLGQYSRVEHRATQCHVCPDRGCERPCTNTRLKGY